MLPARRSWIVYVLFCVAIHAAALLWVRQAGFLAVSDDDYARVVIAQRFVTEPSWDPSGTSWLPFPFWITGGAMRILGATLDVARAAGLLLNLGAGTLLFASALQLGTHAAVAAAVSLICCLLPSSLWLGAAVVPEFFTAALVVFAITSLVHPLGASIRVLGACALAAASASRYEAWPISLCFALWSAWDVGRAPRSTPLKKRVSGAIAGGLAVAFPVLWMAHGGLHHNDLLFFVQRVAHYKQALGDALPSYRALLAGYPAQVLLAEPLPVLSLVAALLVAGRMKGLPSGPEQVSGRQLLARSGALACVQLLVLVLGAARGGAPTHHPERALLSLWMLMIVVAGYLLSRTFPKRVWSTSIPFCVVALLGAHVHKSLPSRIAGSQLRAHEEAAGRALRSLAPVEEVALLTDDYGYFAIMAAAGHPHRFFVADDHDPRGLTQDRPFEAWFSPALGRRTWVTSESHRTQVGQVVRQVGPLSIYQVTLP